MSPRNAAVILAAALFAACTPSIDDLGGGDDTIGEGRCETSVECPDDRPVCERGVCVAACATGEVNASFATAPSDIIWIVDQSGSMNQETAYVQAQINDFAAKIDASGVDYRVTMIASPRGSRRICVPAPLGGPNCGNNTRFRLVDQEVDSNDGPELFLRRYPDFADFLRPDAIKHIIFVTDDDSDLSAQQFMTRLAALAPANMFATYRVHGIYAYGMGNDGCDGPFGKGASNGTVYTQLVQQTMGARGVICENDWTQVFTDITKSIVTGSQLACELELPEAEPGSTLDPNRVSVTYKEGGTGSPTTLDQVPSAAACASGDWYYDDPAAPTRIVLCPSTCAAIQADENASVAIQVGCSVQIN